MPDRCVTDDFRPPRAAPLWRLGLHSGDGGGELPGR